MPTRSDESGHTELDMAPAVDVSDVSIDARRTSTANAGDADNGVPSNGIVPLGVASASVASASGDFRPPAAPAQRAGLDSDTASPTVRQRELGIRLRGYRTALGMTVEEVGARLDVSATKISRLETGKRKAILRDVRDLCEIYGITEPAEVNELLDLARQAREQGWWTRYEDLALSPFIGLEQEASSITSFSMYYVPPLMQTADYARAMIRGIARRMEPKVLDERVEVRLRRQRLLDQPLPPRYRAIMDEAVLRRQVGGLRVMIEQLDKLLAHVADHKAAIQVIPFHVGAYGAADSNFDLLEFDNEPRQNSLIFVEGLFSNLYLERPDQIKRYGEAIEYLRDAALNPRDSATFIGKIRTDYNNSVEPDSPT